MAKRFTDTQKYRKPFIRGLQGAYKLFWDFLYCECDHAGIWIVDFEIAQIYLGKDMPISKEGALKYFNEKEQKIIEVDNGKRWFIPSFIEFQYGELSPENRAHKSVITILKKYNLYNDAKGLVSPLQGRKDKDTDKDKDKDKDKGRCLMKNSGVKIENIKEAFSKTNDLKDADPEHYFNSALDWSNSKSEMRNDWIAEIRNFARKDIRDGKLKIIYENNPRNSRDYKIIPAADHESDRLHPGRDN